MDPECSWWNTDQKSLPPDYILQHEQIHFMLAEVEARKLRARVLGMEVAASSRAEAALELEDRIDAAGRRAIPDFLAVTRRFDDDTSGRYAPEKQAEWLARAQADLARLPASPDLSGGSANPDAPDAAMEAL